ncbi:primosomal replication protein PriB/PriC domain protein [Yersinia ruckeri]|nr:primosomal replication protein PriB/PriC domain protein [Yersinia ruckeri]UIN02487.1 primosomal replication protein PriB/PriC domain protein [Yersinia ruckeri]
MTREDLSRLLKEYIEAESAVLLGKSATLNGQSITMADLSDIRKGRQDIDERLSALDRPRRVFSLARFP